MASSKSRSVAEKVSAMPSIDSSEDKVKSRMLAGEPVTWNLHEFDRVEGFGWEWMEYEGTASYRGSDYKVHTSKVMYDDETVDVMIDVAEQAGLVTHSIASNLQEERIKCHLRSKDVLTMLDRIVDDAPEVIPYAELNYAQRSMADSSVPATVVAAARLGFGLDKFADSGSDHVNGNYLKRVIAEQGYALDKLWLDDSEYVCDAVEWKLDSIGMTLDEWIQDNLERCALLENKGKADAFPGVDRRLSMEDKAAIMRDAVSRGCYVETSIGQDSVEYDERLDAVVHWALEGDGFAWVASDEFLADIYDGVWNGSVRDGDEMGRFVSESEDAYRGGSFGYAPAEHAGEPIFDDETGDYVDWAREAVDRYEREHTRGAESENAAEAYGFDDGGFSDEDDGMEDGSEGLPR